MRESDRNLDSYGTADARHLKSVKQPVDWVAAEKMPAAYSQHSNTTQLDDRTHDRATAETVEVEETVEAPPVVARPHSSAPTSVMSAEGRDRVIHWLQKHVPISRLQHILRVEQFSIELAQHHGLDPEKAAQAGLMHDLAKFFKPQRLLQMAQSEGIVLDPVDVSNPHLLHAAVGAIVARDEFGIHDEVVLDAIRNHTLGCPGMSALSCVVFLADSLEPGRGETPELEALRQSSQQDLYRAVWLTCDESLRYLIARAQPIHPRMVLTRNWALGLTHKRTLTSHTH
jgi:predicted HD superfamily hydrolase involved in NAD metabolism